MASGREIALALGLEARAAERAAAALRESTQHRGLLATTTGDARASWDASALGAVTKHLRSVAACVTTDEGARRSLQAMTAEKGDPKLHGRLWYRMAMQAKASARALSRVSAIRTQAELAALVAALDPGLERFPADTPLSQLAERGAFLEPDGGGASRFLRLFALQRDLGCPVFAFRLQRSHGASAQLQEACRLVAAGEKCVVYVTHATAKKSMLEAMRQHGVCRERVDFIGDEIHSEHPAASPFSEQEESCRSPEKHYVDFATALAAAAEHGVLSAEERARLSDVYTEMQSPSITECRLQECMEETRHAARVMRQGLVFHYARPGSLVQELLSLQRLGLYEHLPYLTQLHMLARLDDSLGARGDAPFLAELIAPCGVGKGDMIALIARYLLRTSAGPRLVVVCSKTTDLVDDLASRALPFLHDVPVHVFGVRGLGRAAALARAVADVDDDQTLLAPRSAAAAASARRDVPAVCKLTVLSARCRRSFHLTATPRDPVPYAHHDVLRVEACGKCSAAWGEILPTREARIKYDLDDAKEALSSVREDLQRAWEELVPAATGASGASSNSLLHHVKMVVRATFAEGVFTYDDVFEALLCSQDTGVQGYLERHERLKTVKKNVSVRLLEWADEAGSALKIEEATPTGNVYTLKDDDDCDSLPPEEEYLALAAMVAELIVYAERHGLRRGFCFAADNARAEYLSVACRLLGDEADRLALEKTSRLAGGAAVSAWRPVECASTSRRHARARRTVCDLVAQMRHTDDGTLRLTFTSELNSVGTNVRSLEMVALVGLPRCLAKIFLLQLLSRAGRPDGSKRSALVLRFHRMLPPGQLLEARSCSGRISAAGRRKRKNQQRLTESAAQAREKQQMLNDEPGPVEPACCYFSADGSNVSEKNVEAVHRVVGRNHFLGREQPSLENVGCIRLLDRRLQPVAAPSSSSQEPPRALVIASVDTGSGGGYKKQQQTLGVWVCASSALMAAGAPEEAYLVARAPAFRGRGVNFETVLAELRQQFELGQRHGCKRRLPEEQQSGALKSLCLRKSYERFLTSKKKLRIESRTGQATSTVQQYWSSLTQYAAQQEDLGAPVRTVGFLRGLMRAQRSCPPQNYPKAIEYAVACLKELKNQGHLEDMQQDSSAAGPAAKRRRQRRERQRSSTQPEWRWRFEEQLRSRTVNRLVDKTIHGYADEVENHCRDECGMDLPPLDDVEAEEKMFATPPAARYHARPAALAEYQAFLERRRHGEEQQPASSAGDDDVMDAVVSAHLAHHVGGVGREMVEREEAVALATAASED